MNPSWNKTKIIIFSDHGFKETGSPEFKHFHSKTTRQITEGGSSFPRIQHATAASDRDESSSKGRRIVARDR